MVSVTEVLQLFSGLENAPAWRVAKAAQRGTDAHQICTAHALGLWIPEIPEEVAGYYASFLRWWPLVKEVLFAEKEFVDTEHGYKGHPDLGVLLVDGRRAVIDLKTPIGTSRTWRGQCAAYLHMTQGEPYFIEHSGTLQLDRDGGVPRMLWYNVDGRDFYAFLSALYAYKYFQKGE